MKIIRQKHLEEARTKLDLLIAQGQVILEELDKKVEEIEQDRVKTDKELERDDD